ncbi:MAG: hypothetical protein H0V01_10485 [Bacteroidetes bacterium]|nr:hypothetical protein [Bacteroidota bacterium]HET6245085.1 hypothetical protein [Bacteroidia bacterium]
MQKITSVKDLKNAIEQLEYKQAQEWPLLKEEFLNTFEKMKPLNVLKSTFKEFTTLPDFKEDIMGATMGITAGYLSKSLVVGESHNPLKKLLGSLLQLGVSNAVSKNSDTIKLVASSLFNLFTKKIDPENEKSF